MATARPPGDGGGGNPTPPPAKATATEHQNHVEDIINMAKTLQSMFMDPKQMKESAMMMQKLLGAIIQHLPAHLQTHDTEPQKAAPKPTNTQKMEKMVEDTYKIVVDLQKRQVGPKKTWAQIAEEGRYASQEKQTRTDASERQFTIKITDETEKKRVQETEAGALLQTIKGAANTACKDIQGIRKLGSGDILVTAGDNSSKETLQKNTEWITVIATTAKATARWRPVEVTGVCRAGLKIETEEEKKEAIKKIISENRTTHAGLKIGRISWQKKKYDEGKTHASLILDLATEEEANNIIEKGLVIDYDVHTAATYSRNWEIKQCYKCQEYGHIAALCKKREACGHCAEEHPTKECPNPEKPRCANCGKKHPTWDTRCQVRMDQREKTRARRAMDIVRAGMQKAKQLSRAVLPALTSEHTRMAKDTFTFRSQTTVNENGKRIRTGTEEPRKQGRPTYIETAGRAPSQTRLHIPKSTTPNLPSPHASQQEHTPDTNDKEDTEMES